MLASFGPISTCFLDMSDELMGVQAGLSGAIAIHAIYGLDETVLFFERPHVGAADSGVTANPYLTVR